MISESDHNQLKMKRLLRSLVNCKILNESQSDLALRQYHSFRRDDCKINAGKIVSFIKNKDRLDDLYFSQLHIDNYEELASILKIFLTISHRQASVERGFSLNKAILKDNIEQTFVIFSRLIKNRLIMRNVKPHTIEISNQLILDVKLSRMKYESYLEEKKKSNKLKEKNKQMNIIQNEEKDLQGEKEQLLSTTNFPDEEFLTLVEKVDKEPNLLLISKATAMKRKAKRKEQR